MVKVVGVLHEFLYVPTCLRIGSDNVDGSDVVTGGEAPHMKVVECLYTVHGQDVMAKGLHIDISGGALQDDVSYLAEQCDCSRKYPYGDKDCNDDVGIYPSREIGDETRDEYSHRPHHVCHHF